MAEKQRNLLPRMEVLIILVFFISFFGWAVNNCSNDRARRVAQRAAERQRTLEDSLANLQAQQVLSAVDTAIQSNTAASTPQSTPNSTSASNQPRSILFVVIDGLKMRSEPNLKAEVLHRFKLFDEIEFMHERTDSTTQLKLSESIIANEPWVKVRNYKGKVGWVYGAGVDYHKQRYPGL
ncbi:MAG: SH3 domain-containing protein [Bacteroidota bacterium]